MPDIVDTANELADLHIAESLAAHRQRNAAASANAGNAFPGLCETCGDDIDPRRLAAVPHACRCLNCQQRHEQKNPFRR